MTIPTLSAPGGAGTAATHWVHNLSPEVFSIGGFSLRWYSLGYLFGILLGYMYLLRLIKQPGAPMARRHADDFVFYVTLGIIFGGRLGYVFFYRPLYYLQNPIEIPQMWDGGMSFHGGLIGSTLAVVYLARKNGLSFLRVADYASFCGPFGLFFVRVANFVNGELWGRPTDVPWAVVFPTGGPVARHPSQLYEAGLEGLLLFAVLWVLFWHTRARYKPGMLGGVFLFGYGLSRFVVEFFREPDQHLLWLPAQTGLSMGQWLTVPMLLLGLFMILTSGRRKPVMAPVEPPAPTGGPVKGAA